MATPVATRPRPAAAPSRSSRTSLRRQERAAFRELNAIFATMLRVERAGCSDETYLAISAEYRAACAEHGRLCAALLATHDPDPDPPAGPAAGRSVDLSAYEPLQREARDQCPASDRGRLLVSPYAAYEASLAGADARLRAEAGALDLLDLRDDGAEPF